MRIFLSYASEQKSVAEPIAFSLRGRGHKVFLDRDDLPPGESYDDQIEAAIGLSDLFIFLISPESLAKGRFTQTELGWARAKWPAADRNVLPVIVQHVDLAQVPTYLKSVTLLEPAGNVAAEVSAAVTKLARAPDAVEFVPRVAIVGALCGLLSGILSLLTPPGIGSGNLFNLSFGPVTINDFTVTVGTFILQEQRFAPLYVPVLFTLGVYAALRLWSTIRVQRLLVMLVIVAVGWIAAINIGLQLPNPFGFNLTTLASAMGSYNEEASQELAKIRTTTETFGLLFNGFVAGAVGAMACALGLFMSLGGPSRRIGVGGFAAIALVGGLAGFMTHPVFFAESLENYLPLFVVWQGCVGAALAYALSISETTQA